ncbi:MAG TPA: M20/M25/M40 family metallo-hydrolase, partial [Deinococcales bacterium]|nr:M20/M25/M40 family metallo-hydrolase [Deinococcales bacterium]
MSDATQRPEQDLKDLFEWLSIPSVSADPDHRADMTRAADWLKARLERSGLQAEIIPTAGHPVVFAQTEQRPDRKTVLVYGHMDVQPADPLDEWNTPPFEPQVRDGFIYARGSSDDKGQVLAHVLAAGRAQGNLPVNLKFLVEGEEEVGSPNLQDFVRQNAAKLACDFVAISDGSAFAPD